MFHFYNLIRHRARKRLLLIACWPASLTPGLIPATTVLILHLARITRRYSGPRVTSTFVYFLPKKAALLIITLFDLPTTKTFLPYFTFFSFSKSRRGIQSQYSSMCEPLCVRPRTNIKIGIASIDNLNSASLPRFARPFFFSHSMFR